MPPPGWSDGAIGLLGGEQPAPPPKHTGRTAKHPISAFAGFFRKPAVGKKRFPAILERNIFNIVNITDHFQVRTNINAAPFAKRREVSA